MNVFFPENCSKAMFSSLKRARNINLPLDCLCSAFGVLETPILLKSLEMWGYKNFEMIEKLWLIFKQNGNKT